MLSYIALPPRPTPTENIHYDSFSSRNLSSSHLQTHLTAETKVYDNTIEFRFVCRDR